MRADFEILQVDDNLDKIITEVSLLIKQQDILELLMGEVKHSLLKAFESTLFRVQEEMRKARRVADNELVKVKCQTGPVIHNFTDYEVPEELSKFMEDGLGNVPELTVERGKIMAEIDTEIKLACLNLFRTLVGCYPESLSVKCSIDSYIKGLIARAPNNDRLLTNLIAMRENYISSLPKIKKLPHLGKSDMQKIIELIPVNTVLSPSDKNLGACLLPPSWYQKEYASQIQKGGYELQEITENQCITLLLSEITKFRANLSTEQRKLLKEKWTRGPQASPRIGVLKLVPKVHKLSGPIKS